jgi:hypothetical protein
LRKWLQAIAIFTLLWQDMTGDSAVPRSLLTFGICVPLAIFLGYLMADPLRFNALFFLALTVMALLIPLVLTHHYLALILAWNASLIAFFLPGQPPIGTVMALASLGIFMLNRSMRKHTTAIDVPQLKWSLLFILVVVLVTARFTGGMSARALGGETWGGKRYLGLLGAIAGYFALTSQPFPPNRRLLYAGLFFLSGTTAVVSDLIYIAGPSFYFLYLVFPSQLASMQATTQDVLVRFSGFTWASLMAIFFLLIRFGIRGTLDLTKPWRLLAFIGMLAFGALGGFRSAIIIIALVLVYLFLFEGLLVTKYFLILVVSSLLLGVFTVSYANRLPMAVQRSLSFLPLDVDQVAKQDAMSTLDWRLQMWKVLMPEVPRYFWLGKGFAFSGTDYTLMQEAMRRGLYSSYEATLISGDYHNGILTIIIPFGIFGLLGFFWFCLASIQVLTANYRYGEPAFQTANTFLLAYFVARLTFYLFLYGQFDLDLSLFTGVVGVSVALNGGVKQPRPRPALATIQSQPEFADSSLQASGTS